ncbi:MAG: hypothetical protein WAK29_09275 [Terriglobales bacterium]
MEKQEAELTQARGGVSSTKKPYKKPACQYERVFETTALSCGKIDVSQHQCQFNGKSS